jgi:hypothetical protein
MTGVSGEFNPSPRDDRLASSVEEAESRYEMKARKTPSGRP